MSKVGFPIRKSTDQRLFAPSRSLSQRTTSFIASYRQGIHQMPLSHLIALICNAHHTQHANTVPSAKKECQSTTRFMLCALVFRKTRSVPDRRAPKRTARINRPEVNQTKPELATVGGKICADSAGYAPQAYPSLRCQISASRSSLGSERNCCLFKHGYFCAGGRLREAESPAPTRNGGARRDRTDDLMLAKHALSQLSYGP